MKNVLMLASAVAAALALGAGAAPAANGPAYCGAANMLAAWPGLGPAQGVGVQPGGGMQNAMMRDNPNGNAGMFHAVAVSCS